MRPIPLIIFASLVVVSCQQFKKNEKSVTVILYDNQNPGLALSVDTLMKAKRFDLTKTRIDVFFCSHYFHLPYHVPTDGLFKTVKKDSECDTRVYPATVKCYEYDNKNRVVKMSVSGSGTMNNYGYKYDDKNQITEITDYAAKYFLIYNSDGTISELRETDLDIQKRLVFIYN